MDLGSGADCKDDEQQEERQHFHVLAVDDSQLDRKLLERLLTVSSYQVTSVESGDKALEYLGLLDIEENEGERSPPAAAASATAISSLAKSSQQEVSKINLIMTDYNMPGISGYDLLKRIKESSSWKDIPVVVMSSENVPSKISMCMEGGAEEFLLKPVKLSDLRKLHSHLLMTNAINRRNDHAADRHSSSNSIPKEDDNNGCSNVGNNKRKTTSTTELSDRSPRIACFLATSLDV